MMFSRLRVVCQILAAMAVIVISDGWTLYDEKSGKPGTTEEGLKFATEHGSVAAAKAGFGTLTEIMMATAQTRDKMVVNTIPYERRLKGGGVLSPNGQNPLGVQHTIAVRDDRTWLMRFPGDHAPGESNIILIYKGPLHD